MRTYLALTTAVLMMAAATARTQTPDAKADPKKIEAGQKAYDTQKCGTCHAVSGKGGKLASALDGVGKKRTEADIKKWLTAPAEMEAKLAKKPTMTMSGYMKGRKLTDADVDALVAYMVSLK
jgi:mono/diheme cytochrome c family protein